MRVLMLGDGRARMDGVMMLEDVGGCRMLEDVRGCWRMLGDVVGMLEDVGRCWRLSVPVSLAVSLLWVVCVMCANFGMHCVRSNVGE
jgi:hypothetical protein